MRIEPRNLTVGQLTDKQLLKLMEIKLLAERSNDVTSMQVVWRSLDGDGFRCMVNYEKWASEESGMTLNKLYVMQIEYLLNEGILRIVD